MYHNLLDQSVLGYPGLFPIFAALGNTATDHLVHTAFFLLTSFLGIRSQGEDYQIEKQLTWISKGRKLFSCFPGEEKECCSLNYIHLLLLPHLRSKNLKSVLDETTKNFLFETLPPNLRNKLESRAQLGSSTFYSHSGYACLSWALGTPLPSAWKCGVG